MSYSDDFRKFSEVIKSLEETFRSEKDYNVKIYAGEEPNTKEFHAHSIILSARSPHFNEILSSENVEKIDEKYIIKEPDLTPQALHDILKYFYTGQIEFLNKTGIEILNYVIAFNKLMLKDLEVWTKQFFKKNIQLFKNNPVGTLQIIVGHEAFGDMNEFFLKAICFEPKILFNSDKFTQLPDSLLEIILKRDDLNLNEVIIWEKLIEWGSEQTKNLKESTQIDQKLIEKGSKQINPEVIHKFISLIRFYDISSKDYMYKVKPFEEVLPKDLRDHLLNFYMIPDYEPKNDDLRARCGFDSVIINRDDTICIANLIDNKKEGSKYNAETIPYKFQLLYRASRDGNSTELLHKKCENKGPTVIIIRPKDSGNILGEYIPFNWNSENFQKFEGLTFSFKNRKNAKNVRTTNSVLNYNNSNSALSYSNSNSALNYNNPHSYYQHYTPHSFPISSPNSTVIHSSNRSYYSLSCSAGYCKLHYQDGTWWYYDGRSPYPYPVEDFEVFESFRANKVIEENPSTSKEGDQSDQSDLKNPKNPKNPKNSKNSKNLIKLFTR